MFGSHFYLAPPGARDDLSAAAQDTDAFPLSEQSDHDMDWQKSWDSAGVDTSYNTKKIKNLNMAQNCEYVLITAGPRDTDAAVVH